MSAVAEGKHRAVVVMGVSGAGKSTIASALAHRLDAVFVDADDLHSPAAKAKMRQGIALTDEDRAPWLRRVAARIAEEQFHGGDVVVACSALRRGYRDVLRDASMASVFFAHLDGTPDVLASRMSERTGHFMPAELLGSQFATLEPLDADERGAVVDLTLEPEAIVERLATALAEPA